MSTEQIELEEEEYTSQLTSPTFKRIAGLVRPHWRWMVGFLTAIVATAALDAFFTYINKLIIDQGIVPGKFNLVMRYAMLYGSIQLIQSGLVFTFIYLVGILGERIQYDLRKSTFNHLQDLSLSYYSQNAVGRLMARVTSDSGRVSNLMTWGLLDVTWAVVSVLTSTIFMLVINWKLGLIVFTIIPILVIIAVNFRRRS
jgi:ATP-binding cassette subfamily B protein